MKILLSTLFVCCTVSGSALLHAQAGTTTPACGGSTTLADSLSPTDAERAKQFLTSLKTAVDANDKAKAASMVQFPVRVYTLNHGHRTIANARQLQAQFDTVFNAEVRQALSAQVPACMFANYRGVMIGDGEIWFRDVNGTYRISSFNHK